MPAQYPGLSTWLYIVLGLLSALLLFVSILVHELAHSIIAKRNGLKIGRITLYLLGGVSEMTEEPPNASLELRMSAAGPLTSLAIALASYVGWLAFASVKAPVIIVGPLEYSALFNLIVAGFNLIPAFPMDGGRVLRSIIWHFNNDIVRSTKIASNVGRFFAYAMMLGGVVISFLDTALLFDGLWFIIIGWFISSGAQSEYRQVLIQRDIADLKAKDMMTKNVDKVSQDITLSELSNLFFQTKHNGFPVMSGDEPMGCVTMHDLRSVKKELWDATTVSQVMTPKTKLVTVKESDPAKEVLSLMSAKQIGRIFVLSDDMSGRLVGIITRTDVVKTIQMQESFIRGSGVPQAPAGSERTVTAEVGMLFQVIAPPEGGIQWSLSFNSTEISMIADQIVQIPPNTQARQFTLQALKKGTFYFTLNPIASKKAPLKYTLIVN
jgi:Zn-dependent protease/CBS domain-containing protein